MQDFRHPYGCPEMKLDRLSEYNFDFLQPFPNILIVPLFSKGLYSCFYTNTWHRMTNDVSTLLCLTVSRLFDFRAMFFIYINSTTTVY